MYPFLKNAKMRKYAVKTIFVQFELIVEDASHILTKQLELRIEYSLLLTYVVLIASKFIKY